MLHFKHVRVQHFLTSIRYCNPLWTPVHQKNVVSIFRTDIHVFINTQSVCFLPCNSFSSQHTIVWISVHWFTSNLSLSFASLFIIIVLSRKYFLSVPYNLPFYQELTYFPDSTPHIPLISLILSTYRIEVLCTPQYQSHHCTVSFLTIDTYVILDIFNPPWIKLENGN